MAAESAQRFEALEAQARVLLDVWSQAGYEVVAPAMIQPADVFLDVVGEQLRARTYVFTDPDGAELCLRPDITLPACRLYLERHPQADARARYCYNGPAFRFQPAGADAAHPREFRQAGLESFGEADRDRADAEVLGLTLEALAAAGLKHPRIRIGDVGLFKALMAAVEMPPAWRQRLVGRFWRRDGFRQELQRLSTTPAAARDALPAALAARVDPDDPAGAERLVADYLDAEGIELIGVRTLEEIAARVIEAARDARERPIPESTTRLVKDFLSVGAPAKAAGARLRDLMFERNVDLSAAIDVYHRRLQQIAKAGVDLSAITFDADFGREIEYYTGFVFEITTDMLGDATPIAGGGRYDGLLRIAGAPRDVAAVGCAIHTERLLSVVGAESGAEE